jgi:hypothetical protein
MIRKVFFISGPQELFPGTYLQDALDMSPQLHKGHTSTQKKIFAIFPPGTEVDIVDADYAGKSGTVSRFSSCWIYVDLPEQTVAVRKYQLRVKCKKCLGHFTSQSDLDEHFKICVSESVVDNIDSMSFVMETETIDTKDSLEIENPDIKVSLKLDNSGTENSLGLDISVPAAECIDHESKLQCMDDTNQDTSHAQYVNSFNL